MKKYLVFIICTVVCISCNTQEERLTESVHRSVYWLWKQQSEDGGWHSSTHTILADGKVLTPYILFHLMQVPDEIFPFPEEAVRRGVAFVQKEIRSSMTMGPDSLPTLNYPNYSAAYALRVLIQAGIDTSLQRVIATHLLQEQFVEHRGITPDHLAYGGWGYGEPGIPYGEHGHVDISHTRRIVEALMLYEGQNGSPSHMHSPENKGQIFPYASATKGRTVERKNGRTAEGQNGGRAVRQNGGLMNVNELSHGLLTRSRLTADGSRLQSQVSIFLAGTQRTTDDPRPYEGCLSRKTLPYDGGFISSSVTLSTNKGEPIFIEGAGLHYPSYATATCDVLMAMYDLGLKETKA